MYQRKVFEDPVALRQAAQERWDQLNSDGQIFFASADSQAAAVVRELQLQKLELELKLTEAERVNDLLTAAINGAPDVIFIKDLAGRYLLMNEAGTKVAGRPCSEIIGRDDRELFGTADAAAIIAQDQAVMTAQTQSSAEQELSIRGKQLIFWTVKTPFHDSSGAVRGIVGSARDITAIKEAENRLSESEQRFRTLADNLPDSLFVIDPQDTLVPLKILYANRAAAERDGYTVEEIIGKSMSEMLDVPSSAIGASERAQRVMRGELVEFEVEHRHRLGHSVPYEVRAVSIPLQGRTVILGINRDITERRKAEQERRESEERYRMLVELAPDSIGIVQDGRGVYFNQASLRMMGAQSPEQLLGRPLQDCLHPDELQQSLVRQQNILEKGEPTPLHEMRVRKLTGEYIYVETCSCFIRYRGRPAIQVIARDITERRLEQEALRKSHDFQQTLIRSAAQGICVCAAVAEFPFVRFSVWNEQMIALTGYRLEEINRRGWYQSLYPDPDDQQRAIERMNRMRERDDLRSEEWKITRKDGQQRFVLISTSVVTEIDGSQAVVALMTDVTAHKQIEAQLRENEARLAEAQEIGGLGSFEVDLSNWQGRCSPALCKIFGFANDEPFRDFLGFLRKYRHPEDHARSDLGREELLRSGTSDEVEHRYLHPDGAERILHVRRRVIRDDKGQAVRLVGTVQDITDRRRAEEMLRASETRYRTFVDHVADAMFLHNPDGSLLDVNQQACDKLGYTREELIGQFPTAFDPDVRQEQLEIMHAKLSANETASLETRHRRKDGSTFAVEVRVRPYWVDGQRYGVSLAQDITQRRINDQALRTSEQRFRELADAIPQIVFTAGPDGGLTHLNARASQYTGQQIQDLTGWSWEQVIHPDDLPATLRDWGEILQTGNPQPLEFRIRRIDGEYRWHIARQTASRDAQGQIVQWYGTCTDIEDHKRAEQALRASEERYRKLFDSIPDPMFVYEPQSLRFLTVNDAAVQKYGYSREEFAQLSIHDIRVRSQQPAMNQVDAWQHRKKNGEGIDVEVTDHELELDGGRVLIALARDVTARRRAETDLRRTTELLRVVAEGTPDAVFVKDREGRYLLFNPAAARFVGKPAAEVIGKDDTALFPPADAAIVRDIDRRVMESERAMTSEETLTAAGVTRTYQAMKAPYRDGNGQIVGTIGISRDITERKRAEEAFRKISTLHETIIHTATEGICLCSPLPDRREVQFSVWNEQMTAFTGYTRDEINRLGWFQTMFRDPESQRAQVRLAKVLDGEALLNEEWEIVRKDGERRILTMSTSLVESDDQQVPLIVALAQDITERRRNAEELALRQAELRHVSRLNTVGQMVAALSHEVAQPLAAISNYAASSSALLKPESGKAKENLEQVRQHIDQIGQQSRRAADIIYRLREYSRKSAPQRVECDLNELLRKSVEMLSLELRGGEVNVIWDLAADLPLIAGDPVQLQQVIVNLLLNARDSLLESSALLRKIALRSRADLGAVVIEVEDNGLGMSEEIAGRLYEPFVTTKPQGMGIGLNICRSILKDHQAEIDYHQLQSGGVLFRVRLPSA